MGGGGRPGSNTVLKVGTLGNLNQVSAGWPWEGTGFVGSLNEGPSTQSQHPKPRA